MLTLSSKPRGARALGVVDEVELACSRRNRLATALGVVLGGVIPVATYVEAHIALDAALLVEIHAVLLEGSGSGGDPPGHLRKLAIPPGGLQILGFEPAQGQAFGGYGPGDFIQRIFHTKKLIPWRFSRPEPEFGPLVATASHK